MFACLSVALVFAAAAVASDSLPDYQYSRAEYSGVSVGLPITTTKAAVDTVYLMGGPDRADGKFQTGGGEPDLQGWTGIDLTARTTIIWHCDTYNAANLDPGTPGNHAWWCGQYWEDDCGTGDFGGYGNNWEEYLAWYGTVANPALSTTVTLNAMLNYDNEPDYDYLNLEYETAGGWVQTNNGIYNGLGTGIVVSEVFTVTPADYVGPGGNQIHIRWRFSSDGGWSDEDCSWTTMGAAQVDLISVFFNQGGGPVQQGVTETCEAGDPVQWIVEFPDGVGDYTFVWSQLTDIDPCRSNVTPQVAFIDHPDVGVSSGYQGDTWRYGPGGYIVNPEGGLAGPDFHIQNEIWSPVLTWPAGAYDGAHFHFEVYRHETLSATAPGVFYVWHVRSVDTGNAGDIVDAGWTDRNFVYYGGPDYLRVQRADRNNVTDLMIPGRTHVQLAMGVYELGWVWNWNGTDGYPAPYFDNALFRVFAFAGPAISIREIDQLQDNFPAIGTIDYGNLGANSIAMDMARNIAPGPHQRNDPGDSVYFDVVPVRTGSVLNDMPKMYYKLFPNPLFNPHRTSGLPNQGWIYGDTCYTGTGSPVGDRYVWDLPDEGFLYPGDRFHYYIEGQDNQGGNIGTTLIPSDTTGFSFGPGMPGYQTLDYNSSYIVRGLPAVQSSTPDDHPSILWWNDFADRGGEAEWYGALNNLGYQEGVDYDLYYTNGPSSGVGNGLGGRATATQLRGYDVILYTAGDLAVNTISNGDYDSDGGNDVGVLDSWFRSGTATMPRNMFITGDDVVFDMTQNGGTNTLAFVSNWMGVNYIDQDVRPLIGNQATPTVSALAGNPVFLAVDEWVAYGGCLGFNTFDALEVQAGATQLAEFLDPNGASGQYTYTAATLKSNATYNAKVISMPYDFMFIYSNENTGGDGQVLSARARVLKEVLTAFGKVGTSPTVPVPDAGVFTVKNYPNPFNPSTKIEFNMPKRGELSIKIYNVRGELVKTLIDEVRPAGADHVLWDGTNNNGDAVSSGVYFYETIAFGKSTVNKMALVK